jgi:hypothetical protein
MGTDQKTTGLIVVLKIGNQSGAGCKALSHVLDGDPCFDTAVLPFQPLLSRNVYKGNGAFITVLDNFMKQQRATAVGENFSWKRKVSSQHRRIPPRNQRN